MLIVPTGLSTTLSRVFPAPEYGCPAPHLAGHELATELVVSKSSGAETNQNPDIIEESRETGENDPTGADGL